MSCFWMKAVTDNRFNGWWRRGLWIWRNRMTKTDWLVVCPVPGYSRVPDDSFLAINGQRGPVHDLNLDADNRCLAETRR